MTTRNIYTDIKTGKSYEQLPQGKAVIQDYESLSPEAQNQYIEYLSNKNPYELPEVVVQGNSQDLPIIDPTETDQNLKIRDYNKKADAFVEKGWGNEGRMDVAKVQGASALAALGLSYAAPWFLKNIAPYSSARGWVGASKWLTPKVAAGIDATLMGAPTGLALNDLVQNGPNFNNVSSLSLGALGLTAEAYPTLKYLKDGTQQIYKGLKAGAQQNYNNLKTGIIDRTGIGWYPKPNNNIKLIDKFDLDDIGRTKEVNLSGFSNGAKNPFKLNSNKYAIEIRNSNADQAQKHLRDPDVVLYKKGLFNTPVRLNKHKVIDNPKYAEKPFWITKDFITHLQETPKRALFGAMVANSGDATGAGLSRILSKDYLDYVTTGSEQAIGNIFLKSRGYPGGYHLPGGIHPSDPAALTNSIYDLHVFNRIPVGEHVLNAGSGKGPKLVSGEMSPDNKLYFQTKYPGKTVNTIQTFPGKDVVPFEDLSEFEYLGQYGSAGEFEIPRVRGVVNNNRKYSYYDAGGYDISLFKDPKTGKIYQLAEDRAKFNVDDYISRYNNINFSNGILGKLRLGALKYLDSHMTPFNVRGNIQEVNELLINSTPFLRKNGELIKNPYFKGDISIYDGK